MHACLIIHLFNFLFGLFVFQMTSVSKEHCLEIVSKFEPCPENQTLGVLGIDGKDVLFLLFNCSKDTFQEI